MKDYKEISKMYCWMVWDWDNDTPFRNSNSEVKLIYNKDEAEEYGAKEVEIIYRKK